MNDLVQFVDGYVTCALWSTSIGEDYAAQLLRENAEVAPYDRSLRDAGLRYADLAPDALHAIVRDCEAFIVANGADLDAYCEEMGTWRGTDSRGYVEDPPIARAGHDFWLTRCGHGCGFWDLELGELGDRLADAARAYGESDIYVGDDGDVYVS